MRPPWQGPRLLRLLGARLTGSALASSGRAWQLWLARRSPARASPLGAQPPPRVPELAASEAAD